MGKVTKKLISLENFKFGYLKGARSGMGFIFFLILCIKEVIGKFG